MFVAKAELVANRGFSLVVRRVSGITGNTGHRHVSFSYIGFMQWAAARSLLGVAGAAFSARNPLSFFAANRWVDDARSRLARHAPQQSGLSLEGVASTWPTPADKQRRFRLDRNRMR